MAICKAVQILWAGLFVITIGLRALASESATGVTIGVFSVAYLIAAIACLANVRVGWIVAILIPILPLLRWTPMVAVNFWMFFTGHELYQDSPATIFIVAINAIIFVVPGLLIYVCLFLDRHQLFAVLWPPATIATGDNSLALDAPVQDTSNPYRPPRSQ